MPRKIAAMLMVFVLVSTLFTSLLPVADASKVTQYRVYQNNTALKEFLTLNQAKQYAAQFNYAHIEKISSKEWVWDNLPKFKVYIDGLSNESLEFATLKEATNIASKNGDSYVRQLDQVGYVYQNFAKFEVYQGDKKLSKFTTLDASKKEAAKWSNAHIIDLSNHTWVWDNISNETRANLKAATKKYEIHQNNALVTNQSSYSFLKEAIMAINRLGSGQVYNLETKQYVFSTDTSYDVFANGALIATYTSLNEATEHAKTLYLAEVKQEDKLYWSNKAYLSVYQGEKLLKHFFTLKAALSYANGFENASIKFGDNKTIWSNKADFIFLGWNGSSTASVIHNHIANTQGLDIDSPTWYYLENGKGDLNDASSAAIVKQYAQLGIDIIPLVHNQFDPKMTSEFLADETARTKFISALITSLKSINAKGFNLDFEEIAAKDRHQFTSFVKQISEAAHAEKLTISIDFLRGDISWNDRTAYDRAAIAPYVDYVIIMAYDQHWRGSTTAGSVAGLKWTEDGIKQYLEYGIPRNKIILGIPFYVREWRIDANNKLVDNKAILMKDIDSIIKDNNATVVFDEKFGQNKVSYQKNGYTHVFWAETVDTVKARVQLAKEYDLAGVAAWRLGYEQSAVWDEMIKLKTK